MKHEVVLTLGPTKTSRFHLPVLDPRDVDDAANSLQSFGQKQRKLENKMIRTPRLVKLTCSAKHSSPSSHLWESGISAANSLSSDEVSTE
jgi:hypothetical protein